MPELEAELAELIAALEPARISICWAKCCGHENPREVFRRYTYNSVHDITCTLIMASVSIHMYIVHAEPKITSGQRSISVQTTERTAQMITRPVIMTDRVNTLRSIE